MIILLLINSLLHVLPNIDDHFQLTIRNESFFISCTKHFCLSFSLFSSTLPEGSELYLDDAACALKKWKEAGSRYFCESFYGHPCPTSGKNYATAYAFGGPSRPASLVAYPTRGTQHRYRNDSTRFRKACIFTTQKALRENTCTIASGDYSTPVSQRPRSTPFHPNAWSRLASRLSYSFLC